MKNRILIGIIAVLVGFLIAGQIVYGPGFLFFGVPNLYHLAIWIPLGIWVFFVWMVWKKKLLYDQREPESSNRRSRWMKIFMLLGGISYALWWICIIYSHPRLGWTIFSEESPLPYIIGLLCAVGSIGFLVISIRYIIKRRKTT